MFRNFCHRAGHEIVERVCEKTRVSMGPKALCGDCAPVWDLKPDPLTGKEDLKQAAADVKAQEAVVKTCKDPRCDRAHYSKGLLP